MLARAALVHRSVHRTRTVRILCAQTDVIGKIGGGETAATRLLGSVPDASITWPLSRPPRTDLQANFDYALIDTSFQQAMREKMLPLRGVLPALDRNDFVEAITIAHAVRGREFDIVECPDYTTYGRFLPFAFAEYGVRYKRLVCSLHGRVSRTLEIENQNAAGISDAELEQVRQSELQFTFGAADIRYGFSERYVNQTRSLHSLPVCLVDPLCALPRNPQLRVQSESESRIWFVGRQDRCKGADLFLAALFRCPELWPHYSVCGPSMFEGMSYCRHRGMPFRYCGPLPYSDIVRKVYPSAAMVVVPSREDTFNLVALEALLSGTPVLISKYAGAVDFIRQRFGTDFAGAEEFDPFDEFASADAIRKMWNEREGRRAALHSQLNRMDWSPAPESLTATFASEARFDADLRNEASRTWDRALRHLFTTVAPTGIEDKVTPVPTGRALFKLADKVLGSSPSENVFLSARHARRLAEVSPHANRARLFRYLAECEETSRPAVAAAYRLRASRIGGVGSLETVSLTKQLGTLGFREEEACFRLCSSEAADADHCILEYLQERSKRLRRVELPEVESIVDRRGPAAPRVSVLVSMYNAPQRVVDHFIKHLSRVEMLRNGNAEVIFIDSGSVRRQQELLESTPALRQISYLIIRSRDREPIQTAWNRGLQWARGEYVTCLGVDEGITESALDDLSDFLDRHPDIDWVTADSVVTQVDDQGRWKRDAMGYSRFSHTRFAYWNDCTYVNYVGGLYRRSIHARVGWYDGTFKGAGDTEFKCRAFPAIRTANFPKTLGFYFDFPADRVTASANIEIEDVRAWYVFRTPGGIDYLMAGQDVPAWEELFWSALSARRCWSDKPAECDLVFAGNVLRGLLKRDPSNSLKRFDKTLRMLIREMRLLQDWNGQPWLGSIAQSDLVERSQSFFNRCSVEQTDRVFPVDFRSDALFFAHSWLW